MTPRARKPKCWSFTAAKAGARGSVYVFERYPGSVLYGQIWNPIKRRRPKRSLGHRERDVAITWAWEQLERLQSATVEAHAPATVGAVLAAYLAHTGHAKPGESTREAKARASRRRESERRAKMWLRLLTAKKRVAQLGRAEWESFIARRSTGEINQHGLPIVYVGDGPRRPVGPRTVDADLVFINAVFNWALEWNGADGQALLDRNPWAARTPGRKRSLERPRNRAPKRPVASYDRFLALHAVAGDVLMICRKGDAGARLVTVAEAMLGPGRTARGKVRWWMRPSYVRELLELAEQTGRRIEAICSLWYSDLVWGWVRDTEEGAQRRGIERIRWRPFKGADEVVLPIAPATRATLERLVHERPGVGDHWLFPSPRKPTQSIDRRLATDWLMKAEQLAKLEHLEGGSWHPWRRKWAIERKAWAIADVMRVGGWTDERSLRDCYQLADDETMEAVINEPRKLMERKA
jgi:hypothetical protein